MKRFASVLCVIMFLGLHSAHAANSPEALVEEYKRALSQSDIKSLIALVAFSPESEKYRNSIEAQFRSRFNKKIVSAKIVPFSTYERDYKASIARGVKPILEPKGWLIVEFSRSELGQGASVGITSVFLVGTRAGSYYLSS